MVFPRKLQVSGEMSGLSHDGIAAFGVEVAEAGVEACVEDHARVRHFYLDGVFVVVLPFFYRVDERSHEMAHARRVFKLVAAGAYGQIKAGQIRLVVNGNPIAGSVVHADDAARFCGNF